jgi:hypothetical protein
MSRQHLVQHAAECPDVGTFVDHLSAGLLGAHVGGRAEQYPITGPADGECRRLGQIRPPAVARFGQPEIEDFDCACRRDLDVRGLQIAVDDAFLVRRFQCFGDLPRNRQRIGE